eukprot:CAMPEP_0178392410 /NCGR_PEP_ID=MMETSP0689_2-20121128/11665_1 /TAXON_ID=160604 /ORGANISM="Amphidinium massartii, Strain CS-259" /LENGTH=437 /DNA_ID=CAMNT_0020012985 /DNA_START=59 /DNA_END=1369 /DNA_ORIENTATION=+
MPLAAEALSLQMQLESTRAELEALIATRFAELEQRLASMSKSPPPADRSDIQSDRQLVVTQPLELVQQQPENSPAMLGSKNGLSYRYLPLMCDSNSENGSAPPPLTVADRRPSAVDALQMQQRPGRSNNNSDREGLPTSLFSWCMWAIANTEGYERRAAIRWLIFMLVLQHIMMLGFTEAVIFANVQERWHPPQQGVTEDATACIYSRPDTYYDFSNGFGFGNKMISDQPGPILAVGISAMVLITYSISVQDLSVLQTVYPGGRIGPWTSALVIYSWFCQAVFLPSIFAACVSMLLADSHDALTMVMNTLAVTFLLEVDDMLYDAVLDEEEKQNYQGCCTTLGLCSDGRAVLCSSTWHGRALKIFDFSFMVMIFLYFRFQQSFGPRFVEKVSHADVEFGWENVVSLRWLAPYALRAVVHSSAWWDGQVRACGHAAMK